jgi:hypothetical protein
MPTKLIHRQEEDRGESDVEVCLDTQKALKQNQRAFMDLVSALYQNKAESQVL